MIVIIDYGLGNLRSVFNGLRKNRAEVRISSEIQEIEKADKLVFPGVGSFSSGMENLQQRNLIPVLIEKYSSSGLRSSAYVRECSASPNVAKKRTVKDWDGSKGNQIGSRVKRAGNKGKYRI